MAARMVYRVQWREGGKVVHSAWMAERAALKLAKMRMNEGRFDVAITMDWE